MCLHDNSSSVNKLDIMLISNNQLISIFFKSQGGSRNKTQTGLGGLDKMRDNLWQLDFKEMTRNYISYKLIWRDKTG